MEVPITSNVTVDGAADKDGQICINVYGSHSEAYAYLSKEDVEKLLSFFN